MVEINKYCTFLNLRIIASVFLSSRPECTREENLCASGGGKRRANVFGGAYVNKRGQTATINWCQNGC